MYAHVFRIHTLTLAPPHHHLRFTALFPGPPGRAGARRELLTLWCKGRLTEADTPTIRLGATPSGLTSAHLHHLPHFSPSTKNNLTIMIISYIQVVKIIDIRPHRRHTWTVQSYSLGRAIYYMLLWDHPNPYPKWHLNWFSHFCTLTHKRRSVSMVEGTQQEVWGTKVL